MPLIMHVALLVDILQRLPVMWLDRLIIIGGCNSDEHVCRYQSVGWAWAYMCLTLVQGCCSPAGDCALVDHHHIRAGLLYYMSCVYRIGGTPLLPMSIAVESWTSYTFTHALVRYLSSETYLSCVGIEFATIDVIMVHHIYTNPRLPYTVSS